MPATKAGGGTPADTCSGDGRASSGGAVARFRSANDVAALGTARVPWLPGRARRLAPDAPGAVALLPLLVLTFAMSLVLPAAIAGRVRSVGCIAIVAIVVASGWLRVCRRRADRSAWTLIAASMTLWGVATW